MEVATTAPRRPPRRRKSEAMGAVWTYDEIAAAVPKESKKAPALPPDCWPDGVRVDEARWVYWLPTGFGQGVKRTSTGKDLKCYVSPDGKLFYHKKDIEKALGYELGATPPSSSKSGDLDRAPLWDDRLPKDWRIAFRRLPSGTAHKIFITPDEDRFLWHIKDVELYLAGSSTHRGTPLHGGQHARASAVKKKPSSSGVLPPERETPAAKRRGTPRSDIELMPGQVPALKKPRPGRAEEPKAGPSSLSRCALSEAVAAHPLPRESSAPPGADMSQDAVTGPPLALTTPERQRTEAEEQAARHGGTAAAGDAMAEHSQNLIRVIPAQGILPAFSSTRPRSTHAMPALRLAAAVCAALAAVSSGQGAASPECQRFDQIYASGRELCENMWGDAFVYEPNEEQAYTMWFFDSANPNDNVSRSLGKLAAGGHEACHLQYFHKDTPGPEPDNFTECHPWKADACCAHGTVETYTTLKEAYGPEYHWDRCGPLSQECERFFVQEACFYECDPNAGYYRRYNLSTYDARCDADAAEYDEAFAQANDCDHNAWEMHRMPIKASYCDAWYTACRNDRFCAHDDGDYFSCAAVYQQVDAAGAALTELNETRREVDALRAENERLSADAESDDGMGVGAIVGIIVPSVLAVVACVSTCVLVRMEKAGKPLFMRLMDDRQDGPGAEAIGAGRT